MERKDKDQRMTFEELHNKYGFEYSAEMKGIHPVYKKHLEATWVIDAIWAYVEKEEISTSKARQLTSAVIEESVESFRLRVIEELEGMMKKGELADFSEEELKIFPIANAVLFAAIERIKNLK